MIRMASPVGLLLVYFITEKSSDAYLFPEAVGSGSIFMII
jgi:hypothetical protein